MGTKDLDMLAAVCGSMEQPSTSAKISKGSLTWFRGTPAPADEGSVSLSLSNGARVTLARDDVVEADRDGDIYWIALKHGTSYLADFSVVGKTGESCECGTGQQTAARQATGTLPDHGEDLLYCRQREVCAWYKHPDGTLRYVCVPYIECIKGPS